MNDTPRQWNHNVVLRLLSREASSLQANIRAIKKQKALAWARAVPGTKAGECSFKVFSNCRQTLLTYKKQLKQVNACIKAIKSRSKRASSPPAQDK